MIIKTCDIEVDQTKFLIEAWLSDYINRFLTNGNINGTPITNNFVEFYDIFACNKKLSITNIENKCTKYQTILENNKMGYIIMEKLDGTLSMLEHYDCGILFEFLYGKLVAFKHANIIFTDQSNPGNCGYKKVDYCRKYIIKHNEVLALELYINNENMIKIFDFDNYALISDIDNIGQNFFYDINDTFKDGDDTFDTNNIYKGLTHISNTYALEFIGKIKSTELNNYLDIISKLRAAFETKTQVKKFIEIINEHIPDHYKQRPSGRQIKEYEFNITTS